MEKMQGKIVEDFEVGRKENYWIAFQCLEPPRIIFSCRRGVPLFVFEKSILTL